MTFEKSKKRTTSDLDFAGNIPKDHESTSNSRDQNISPRPARPAHSQMRMVSHNQQILPMPEVYLEMNRHIIPDSLFHPVQDQVHQKDKCLLKISDSVPWMRLVSKATVRVTIAILYLAIRYIIHQAGETQ